MLQSLKIARYKQCEDIMADKKDYMTKTVSLAGKTVTLYSLDGNTWSSRAQELTEIQERHANQKVTFVPSRGPGPRRPAVAAPVVGAEDEEIVEEVLIDDEDEVAALVPAVPDDDDDEEEDEDGTAARGAKGRKKAAKDVFAELGIEDEEELDDDEQPRAKGAKGKMPAAKGGAKGAGKSAPIAAAKGKASKPALVKPQPKAAVKPAAKAKVAPKAKPAPKAKAKPKKK